MSGLSKDLLVFDAANANDSDNVGAFLRGATGEVITTTAIGPVQALDVNVANALTIDVDLDQSTDSVAIGDGTNLVSVSVAGELSVAATDFDIRDLAFATDKVDVSGSAVTVSATDLDIRNLLFATDKVDVSGSAVTATVTATDLDIRNLVFATDKVDASGSVVALDSATLAALETITVLQGTSPWVVSATDLDIRDLNSASDSVTVLATDLDIRNLSSASDSVTVLGNVADDAVDSGNPIKVGSRALTGPLSAISSGDRADLISDLYRRIYINDSANIGLLATASPVADSAVNLIASALGGRRELLVQNLSSQAIFVGGASVTTATGTRIAAGASGSFKVGPNVALYAISGNATAKDVRVLELA